MGYTCGLYDKVELLGFFEKHKACLISKCSIPPSNVTSGDVILEIIDEEVEEQNTLFQPLHFVGREEQKCRYGPGGGFVICT